VSGGWARSATPEISPAIITTQARLVISGVIVDDPGREAGTAGFSMNLARSVQIAEREIAVPVVRTRDKRVTDAVDKVRANCSAGGLRTDLLEAGEPEHVIEAVTGHLSRRMLEHYSHIREREEGRTRSARGCSSFAITLSSTSPWRLCYVSHAGD